MCCPWNAAAAEFRLVQFFLAESSGKKNKKFKKNCERASESGKRRRRRRQQAVCSLFLFSFVFFSILTLVMRRGG